MWEVLATIRDSTYSKGFAALEGEGHSTVVVREGLEYTDPALVLKFWAAAQEEGLAPGLITVGSVEQGLVRGDPRLTRLGRKGRRVVGIP